MLRLFLLFLVGLSLTAPAAAEWRRAESPNFIVYSEGSESRLRERILLLEDFDRLLRNETSVTAPPAQNKLHVYILEDGSDLRAVRPMGTGVAGFYAATPHGVAAFVDASAEAGGNEILFHEYAHHFMWQYAPAAYPLWYSEGFAEYFSTARFTSRTISIGNRSEGRGYSLVLSDWLPAERILFGDMRRLSLEDRAQFYAQSWLMVHYFFSTPQRQAALRNYLTSVLRDGPSPEAFEAATGIAPDDMQSELRRYVGRGRITYVTYPRGSLQSPPPVTISRLPLAADDLILIEAALRIGLRDETQAATLERARAAAARHPSDPYAQRVLAHAEAVYGDAAAADRLLGGLLATTPADAELLYLRGMRHLRAAQEGEDWETHAAEARRWFTQAHAADGNHFQTLYGFVRSLQGSPELAAENTSNVMLLAHSLAPQVAEIRMNAAALLMNRGQFEPAEALLQPLAAMAHDASTAEAARRLLEQARARTRPGVEPVEVEEEEE